MNLLRALLDACGPDGALDEATGRAIERDHLNHQRRENHMIKALVIPSEGPLFEVELEPDSNGSSLKQLQELVGGYIQALPLPDFIDPAGRATAYVNEEGKFDPDCPPNMRATDFFVPGIGIFAGDYIAGACVLCGFDPEEGENRDVPQAVIDRARLIEREAS